MWFIFFHVSLIPSILFTAICRDMPQSKAVVIEKWLRFCTCILLMCFTLLKIVIKLSVINFGLSGIFSLLLFGVGVIVLNFGLGTDSPGRDIRALSQYPRVVCAGIELTTRTRPPLCRTFLPIIHCQPPTIRHCRG